MLAFNVATSMLFYFAGNSSQTFNGSTSSAVYNGTNASNISSMQFSIRTRSSNGLVLASGMSSTHFLAIGLNGGKIELIYHYRPVGTEDRIQGGRYCFIKTENFCVFEL